MKTRRWGLVAVLATILALLMVGPAFAGGPPGDPPGLQRAIAAQDAHNDALLARPGVVGTAVGLGADGQAVVVIYTASPGVGGLPNRLDGVQVDVVVTGIIVARTDPKAWQSRPVPVGVSTGHPDISAGTIGARVTDGTDVFALSNNHVYANINKAKLGDSALQPGAYDGGEDPADKIGELFAFEPLLFDGSDNTIDAAIVLSSTADLDNATPSDDGYGTPNSTTAAASINQLVKKYGRTTGLTHGQVKEINVTVNVCYKLRGPFCNPDFIAKFVDQIAIASGDFSAGGDSGSLIVTDDTNNNPVGLLFAGSSTRTIANRIDPVLARFGVTIDDRAAPAPPPPAGPQAPVANAGPDQTVIDGDGDGMESITLDGSGSTDSDGTIDSYEWDVDGDGVTDLTGVSVTTSFSVAGSPHTVTLKVTDNDGLSDTDNVAVTVSLAPAEPTAVFVTSPSGTDGYATEGGKNGDKHLLVTVALVDDLSNPVAGASVSVRLDFDKDNDGIVDQSWTGAATTGGDGKVTFNLKNAKSGCYTTDVTAVSDPTWDGATPANEFCK